MRLPILLACLLLASTAPAFATTVDYTSIAAGSYGSVSLAGTTVTGSSNVVSDTEFGFTGLGIQGGSADFSLDAEETLTINYNQEVNNVFLTFIDIDPVGNATLGFTAFDGALNLGSFTFPLATSAPQTDSVSSFASNHLITSIALTELPGGAPRGFQIQSTSFTAVPEPASLLMLGTGLLSTFAIRIKAKRSH